MTQHATRAAPAATGHPKTSLGLYAAFTLTAAAVAATAAGLSLMAGLPPWAMFVGWVAYFTRTPSLLQGAWTFACLTLGLGLGAVATLALGVVGPVLGPFALPAVVFVSGGLVIATRGLPILNNLLGYFLGLITFFAAHLPPTIPTLLQLAAALVLGLTAGWFAQTVERGVRSRRPA